MQLLFLKPRPAGGRAGRRAVPEPRRYLEACIYSLDLALGKRYNLFLSAQPGPAPASKKGRLARYLMTAPPILASKKSTRKILGVTCPDCGE